MRGKTNATPSPASFVGRERELTELARLFSDGARLVTLVAPGGMGKTTIATRYAHEHAAEYSAHGGGGAWICDLTEARSSTAIGAVVAQSLGVPLESSARERDVLAALGRIVAARNRILLVLDNFEHLAQHAATTLGEWLQTAPQAHFLVTSRVPLGLPGEQLMLLDALGQPEAVDLFLRRSRQVRPRDAFAADDLQRVDTIVRRLDGIPLAIELAAARSFVLSFEQIEQRLDAPLELLVRRGDLGRHASMRRAIVDSFRLLSDDEKEFFAGCAVFHGGFTLEAAEVVLGDQALARLDSLCVHSLVRVVAGVDRRFSMYETIRELSVESFATLANAAEIRQRHAIYFGRAARQLGEAALLRGGGPALRRLDAELDNIVVAHEQSIRDASAVAVTRALSLATSLEPAAKARGLFRLRLRLLEQALALAEHSEVARRNEVVEALLARGEAHSELGDFGAARRDFNAGLALAEANDESSLRSRALMHLGELLQREGATGDAREHYERALRYATQSRTPLALAHEAQIRRLLGHALRREGELDAARVEIDRAVMLFREVGHGAGLARACYERAAIAFFLEQYADARAGFAESLAVALEVGATDVAGASETATGSLLQELGQVDAAIVYHAAAVVRYREVGNRYREGGTLYYLAGAHYEKGDGAEADKLLQPAGKQVQGEARYEALIAGFRATLLAQSGNFIAARNELSAADDSASRCAREPSLLSTIAIHRLHVDALVDSAARAAKLAAARKLAAMHACDDPRFALRIFSRGASRQSSASLLVDEVGFRAPGQSRVSLTRRPYLRRLLRALAQKRIDAPGDALALDELVDAAWPGEKILPDAAVNRVRVAIATLRKLGLRELLLSTERGYLLTPAIAVTMVPVAAQ